MRLLTAPLEEIFLFPSFPKIKSKHWGCCLIFTGYSVLQNINRFKVMVIILLPCKASALAGRVENFERKRALLSFQKID